MEFVVAAIVAVLISTVLVLGQGQEPWQAKLATSARAWLLLGPGLALYWFVARSAEGILGMVGQAAAWVKRRLVQTS